MPMSLRKSRPGYFAASRCFKWSGGILLAVTASWLLAIEPSQGLLPSQYPPGQLGATVKLGEAIVRDTANHSLSKPFVGNSLNCTSCHLDAGQHELAASFIGTATAYPAWAPREKKVVTLEDRILNCFLRSQNGTRPPNGSDVSVAIAAYITWLSSGQAIKMNANGPLGPRRLKDLPIKSATASIPRGKTVYRNQCADCHADNGEGTDSGPPVWGEQSYNDGAGLAGVDKLAAWLKVAMPLDAPELTDQEAVDVAAYMNAQARPAFRP
jgi:thiosulfate dehydrogenase